jgi:arginase
MNQHLQFLGWQIDAGQSHHGVVMNDAQLANLCDLFEKMNTPLAAVELISRKNSHAPQKVYTEYALSNFDWLPYQQGFDLASSYISTGKRLINWGGDHSIGFATSGAFCKQYPDGMVVWIDAHADLNLPAVSPSGNLHGMPVSLLMNLDNIAKKTVPWMSNFLPAENLIYVGLRDLDPFEVKMLNRLNIKFFSAKEVHNRGIHHVTANILESCAQRDVHVSFDIDSVCPKFAPSTGLRVAGGLLPYQIMILARELSQQTKVRSVDVVEINSQIGSQLDVLRTQMIAIEFIKQLFPNDSTNTTLWRPYDRTCFSDKNQHTVANESGFQI